MSRSLARQVLTYGTGSALQRGIGLLLLPAYAHYLTLAEFGVLALLQLVYQLANRSLLLGVDTATVRFYYDGATDRVRLVGAATAWTLVSIPVGALLLGPGAWVAGSVWLPGHSTRVLLGLVVAATLFVPAIQLRIELYRAQERAGAHVAFQVAYALGFAVVAIGLLAAGRGLLAPLAARAIVNIAAAVYAVVSLRRTAPIRFDRDLWKQLAAFGAPLVPFFLLAWANRAAGRFFLEGFADLAEVGRYAVASAFAGVLLLSANAADSAIVPRYYRAAQQGDANAMRRWSQQFLAWTAVLAMLGIALGPLVARWLTPTEYHDAIPWIGPLLAATWLFVLAKPLQWRLTEAGQTGALARAQRNGLVASVVALMVLVAWQRLGVAGAIAAVAVGHAVYGWFAFRAARRDGLPRPAVVIAAGAAVGLGAWLIDPTRPWSLAAIPVAVSLMLRWLFAPFPADQE